MKKFLFVLASLIIFSPSATFAINLGTGSGSLLQGTAVGAGYSPSTGETTFSETLGTVVKAALSLAGVIFMVLMVYAGFLWMTAHGNEDQIDKAQDIIRSSVIGLIIAVGAYSITNFILPRILQRTTGPSGGAPTVGAPASGPSGTFTDLTGQCAWILGDGSNGSETGIADSGTCGNDCALKAASKGTNLTSCTFGGCRWTLASGSDGSDTGVTDASTCQTKCQSVADSLGTTYSTCTFGDTTQVR